MTVAPPPSAAIEPVPPAPPPVRRKAEVFRVLAAMIGKEVRELGPWLLMVMLAYSVGLAFVLYRLGGEGLTVYSTFLTSSFFAVSIFVPPAAALLLGFVQMEIRPDRYAFLVHRPAARSLIFWCKLLTGIPLYLLALGMPLMVALFWLSSPRNFPAPFSWEMALVPIADILMGIPFYLAGMVIARRTGAHWWGSRVLPVGAPCIIGVLAMISPSFFTAVVILALGALLYVIPARALFLSGGEEARLPVIPRASLGLMLVLGTLLAGFAALGIVSTFTQPRSYLTNYVYYQFLIDGTPVRTIMKNGKQLVETLDGKPLSSASANYLSMSPTMVNDGGWTDHRPGFHEAEHYFRLSSILSSNVSWFRHAGGDYLVGYDFTWRQLVGAIGPDGFVPDVSVPPSLFPSPVIMVQRPAALSAASAVIASGTTAFEFKSDKSLTPFFTAPDHSTIRGIGQVVPDPSATEKGGMRQELFTCITTQKTLYILNLEAQLVAQVPLEYGPLEYVTIGRIASTGEFIVRINRGTNLGKDDKVLVVTTKGEVARTFTLPEYAVDLVRSTQVMEDYALPAMAPPAGMTAMALFRQWMDPAGMAPDRAQFQWAVFISFVVAVPLAIGMFFLARHWRMKTGATVLWTLLLLLLGPSGIFLLLFMRGIPVRVRCHVCGNPRPVDQAACPTCGNGFALPARNGTEIFV